MRAVCFVKKFEFELSGTISPKALVLKDVDNDGNNELVIGNMNGDLAIFKSDRLWQKVTGLGMITAVDIGDVFNCGSNALVVIGGDGWCHILCRAKVDDTSEQKNTKLESVHVQRIPPNTKVVLLGDIDGDGFTELVVGLTDRVVRSYRWLPDSDQSGAGKLVGLHKWECASQIGTVTLNHMPDGKPCLLVSQPGGKLLKIHCHVNEEVDSENDNSTQMPTTSVKYHSLTCGRMRNQNVSTEIQGDLRTRKNVPSKEIEESGYAQDDLSPSTDGVCASSRYAVATLDGTLMLVQDEVVMWSMQVDHQIFALTKLDMTGDGRDEIVACSWDGQTYILDQDKCSVRFQLEESVVSFCSGYYTLQAGQPAVPCLVYTTFNNKIYVYYDVQLSNIKAKRFIPNDSFVMEKSPREQQLLVEWCLYGHR